MRQQKFTVLAFGEGEDEKIFLRHLSSCYCRKQFVAVKTGSAGGSTPECILAKALQARQGEERDVEFIVLDTDNEWSVEMIEEADETGIWLIGNSPCLEALFLEILDPELDISGLGSGRCKKEFEQRYCSDNNFDEDNCPDIFTKAKLNEARKRIPNLNKIITAMEGSDIFDG